MKTLQKLLISTISAIGLLTAGSLSISADQTLYFGTQQEVTKQQIMEDKEVFCIKSLTF